MKKNNQKAFLENKNCSLAEFFSEFLGSMLLVMASISPMILFISVLESSLSIAVIAVAISVAYVLFALIEIFKSVSGAHFNPLVTIIMTLEKKMRASKAIFSYCFSSHRAFSRRTAYAMKSRKAIAKTALNYAAKM